MGKALLITSLSFVICLFPSVPVLLGQSVEATAASYVEMGNNFARNGDNKLAIGAYTVALEYAPKYSPAYFGRGVVHQVMGNLPLAVADYTKTLEISPSCSEAYANRGYAFSMQREVEKAARDFEAALQINPKLGTVYYNRGNLRLEQGDI